MYNEIKKCRICGNAELVSILSLGNQYLTGVFPKDKNLKITSGPLELVKCRRQGGDETCGLVQLRHSYDLDEMYGLNYGYRSGLNRSMVNHLREKVKKIQNFVPLSAGDMVIDIGSNDSTLLQGYANKDVCLVGIDPTGRKFREYYPDYIQLIPDFFSSQKVKEHFGNKKAKVVTSIAMFYDLESPLDFMHQIREVLADDGVWVFEQSYMPTMLEMNAYDTVCHEHLEYYGLKQIKWMADKAGFKILDVEFNAINGGSFSVMVGNKTSSYKENVSRAEDVLRDESRKELHTLKPYEAFKQRVNKHKDDLMAFIKKTKTDGKTIYGYGASTKGNVILQFCNITTSDIPLIAEVNKDKFGCFTPGTGIPIVSEEEARAKKPDYFMVLPWHFKENIVSHEQKYLTSGGKLFFPLPSLEVVCGT